MEFNETRIKIDKFNDVLFRLSDSCSHDPEELSKIISNISTESVPEDTTAVSIGKDYKWGYTIFKKDDLFYKAHYVRRHLDRLSPFHNSWILQKNYQLAKEREISVPELHGFFSLYKAGHGWIYSGSIEENLSDCLTLDPSKEEDIYLMKNFINNVSEKKFVNYDMHFGNVMKDSSGKCIMVDLDNCDECFDPNLAKFVMQNKCLSNISDEEIRWKVQKIFEL